MAAPYTIDLATELEFDSNVFIQFDLWFNCMFSSRAPLLQPSWRHLYKNSCYHISILLCFLIFLTIIITYKISFN